MFAANWAPGQQAPAGAKAIEFDVVSIKPNNGGDDGGAWGVSENKYFAKNTTLNRVILQAFLGATPSDERLKSAPSWVKTEPYDITAKVDNATATALKDLRQSQQVAIVAPMLRSMLQDRCKLVAHTVPTEVSGYVLVVGRHGIRMKEAQPGEPVPPQAVTLHGLGGWKMVPMRNDPDAPHVVQYLGVTMAELVAFLGVSGEILQDETGLTKRYDLTLPVMVADTPQNGENKPPAPRPDTAHLFDWAAAGLEMKPIRVPALDLVIDHIERPTPN